MADDTHAFGAAAGRRLRQTAVQRLADARLYVCTDARPQQGDLERFLHAAYAGGVDIIQLRDKNIETDDEIAALQLLAGVAREHDKLFAVNDRADIAALVGADVFHIGQRDLTPAQARSLLGSDVLIGRSTHTLDQARAAMEDVDVDYFCTGPLWETPTKPGRPATGLELVRDVVADPASRANPWFAIGGIDSERLSQVLDAGASRIVVVRAVTQAADAHAAADELRQMLPA